MAPVRRAPSVDRGNVRARGELRVDLAADALHHRLERQLGREAGSLAMAAAAEAARDRRDVDLAVGRAQADLARAFTVEQLAHERGDDGALDLAHVVDDPLG